MAKIKELVMDVMEYYDEQGLSVMEIAERLGIPKEMVLEIVKEYGALELE